MRKDRSAATTASSLPKAATVADSSGNNLTIVAVIAVIDGRIAMVIKRKFWMNYFGGHLCRDYVAVVLKGSIEKAVGRTLFRVEKSATLSEQSEASLLSQQAGTHVRFPGTS